MKPTIGRIVHYKDERDVINAAIITKVWNDTCVDLFLLKSRPEDELEIVVRAEGISSAILGDDLRRWNWPVIETSKYVSPPVAGR